MPRPRPPVEAFARYENEERSIEYVVLTAATAGEIAAPCARRAGKIFRGPQDHVSRAGISQADRARADARRDSRVRSRCPTTTPSASTTSARRAIRRRKSAKCSRWCFPNAEDAKKAAEQIAGGAWFEVVAVRARAQAERHQSRPGDQSRDRRPGDRGRRLRAQGRRSQRAGRRPFRHRAGARQQDRAGDGHQPFADVAADIKREIAAERAKAEISKRRDKIEDELAGGARLDEAAQKAGTPVRTIAAVDRSGRGPDGNPVADLPQGVDILTGAFSTDVGVESDPVQAGGGFVWFEVAGITPRAIARSTKSRTRSKRAGARISLAPASRPRPTRSSRRSKPANRSRTPSTASGLKIETAKSRQAQRRRQTAAPRSSPRCSAPPRTPPAAPTARIGSERIVFKVTDIVDSRLQRGQRRGQAHQRHVAHRRSARNCCRNMSTQVESDLGATINRAVLNQAVTGGGGN